jgi:hypothetical protein
MIRRFLALLAYSWSMARERRQQRAAQHRRSRH